jgi:hypothetical protein
MNTLNAGTSISPAMSQDAIHHEQSISLEPRAAVVAYIMSCSSLASIMYTSCHAYIMSWLVGHAYIMSYIMSWHAHIMYTPLSWLGCIHHVMHISSPTFVK